MKKVLIIYVSICLIFLIVSCKDKEDNSMSEWRRVAEKKKNEEIQYNQEHKEDNYQAGIKYIEEKNYREALSMFKKVLSIDENYKDVKSQIENTKSALEKATHEKAVEDANKAINEAEQIIKADNNYRDLLGLISRLEKAVSIIPDSKQANDYLIKAKLERLKYFEGNNQIQMAVHFTRNKPPYTYYVTIKNLSNEARRASPNYFTLITVKNRSYSISNKTFSKDNYFDGVNLQPNTTTSGIIVFDTHDAPKKLIYEDSYTTISREFPFK